LLFYQCMFIFELILTSFRQWKGKVRLISDLLEFFKISLTILKLEAF